MDYGDAAAALGRLRHLQRHLHARLPGRRHAAAARLADPDAVGPRRDQRLGLPRHRPTRRATRPTHTVLMHVAVGDHQVANVMSDVEARTIGASAYRPAVAARAAPPTGRRCSGSRAITSFPFNGSAIVYWDGGPQTPPAPPTQHPEPRRARPARVPAQHGRGRARAEVARSCRRTAR